MLSGFVNFTFYFLGYFILRICFVEQFISCKWFLLSWFSLSLPAFLCFFTFYVKIKNKNEGMSLIVNDRIIQILGHEHKKVILIIIYCVSKFINHIFFFFDKNYQSYLS